MNMNLGVRLCIVVICFLPMMQSSGQENTLLPDKFLRRASASNLASQGSFYRTTPYRILGKKASQYTAEDWGKVIDSTWGPGQTGAQQLNVFDTFWNLVDRSWSGFPNLALNWDSIRAVYRPQIGSGLSRGRFLSLMSRLWLATQEHHTWIVDDKVESIFGTPADLEYRAGVPLLCINTGFLSLLGAAITPMPDSSGLVYRVTQGNPLGLVPGDLVLGYEGVPWKRLYQQTLDDGVPVSNAWSSPGSSPESRTHEVLSSVGWNWSMFETIDVVKYSTGDTLHLPTAPLLNYTPTLWATDQVPIAGVPMPQGCYLNGTGPAVSWGVVQGTNIGYVYVWEWDGELGRPGPVAQLFHDAIYDLRHNKNVDGLVLDFRTNWGGWYSSANGGFSQLFNFDPTSNMSRASRNSATNHMGFSSLGEVSQSKFTPGNDLFDRPIAVLIGPAALSMGDWNSFRMRFHPMARSFGKPTNGAFVGGSYATGTLPDGWSYNVPTNVIYSNVPGEGWLVHKGARPDEEVWLTRDGVAKGEDDVVKRALEWITTLSYALDVKTSANAMSNPNDSITVTVRIANPGSHTLVVSAIVTTAQGVQVDSLVLMNDGLHGDGAAADSIRGNFIKSPADGGKYYVSVRTDDSTSRTYRRLPNVALFDNLVSDVKNTADNLPQSFGLEQNYPNPFNPKTVVGSQLPVVSDVRIVLHDMLGREVKVLVNERRTAGYYRDSFDASGLASGVYICRLAAGTYIQSRKMMLLK
jgi:hypothetical protein